MLGSWWPMGVGDRVAGAVRSGNKCRNVDLLVPTLSP